MKPVERLLRAHVSPIHEETERASRRGGEAVASAVVAQEARHP